MRRWMSLVGLGLLWTGLASASESRPPIYLSTDCEADGRIPGPHSMLSFATVAYDENKKVVGEFAANLDLLPDAEPDPVVMKWWHRPENVEAYRRSRVNTESPARAMKAYVAWIESLPGEPIFLAYPATFDFMFVYWYMIRFADHSPFQHRGLDVRSFAMGFLGSSFRGAGKESLPREWFDPLPHTHDALDDAREQGALFLNMLKAREDCEIPLELPGSGF